jgi:hypothetical protein
MRDLWMRWWRAAASAALVLVALVACRVPLGGDNAAADLDLSGRWAFLQVTSQIGAVPFAGERTRATSSVALVDTVQDGLVLHGVESACSTTIDY